MTDRSTPPTQNTPQTTPQGTPSPYAAGAAAPDALPIGPITRANAAKVLEQALSAVWAGILESHGHRMGEQWDLVIGELHLERHREDVDVAGGAAPANGALAQ